MSDFAIRVEGLSKRYRIGETAGYGTLRETLSQLVRRRREPTEVRTVWALRDATMEVMQGEVVGVIGSNGAGKSTLLKLLARITEPSGGRADVRGRIGSLLEVGTGFHPELTGRENIFLNGAILGMRRREIARKFDDIVSFAEIERFLDTPVKRYSSGMYLRLAFAVAAHLQHEILLVDEVLAVGDAVFQRRCLGKIDEVARGGRTVLFVSHNMEAVRSLTDRVVLLRDGAVAAVGTPDEVIASYLSDVGEGKAERTWSPSDAPGGAAARLLACRLRHDGTLTVRSPMVLEFDVENRVPGQVLNVSIHLRRAGSGLVFNTFSIPAPLPAGTVRFSCSVPGDLLNDGPHSVDVLVVRDRGVELLRERDVLMFTVEDRRDIEWFGSWSGAIRPRLEWDVRAVTVSGGGSEEAPTEV